MAQFTLTDVDAVHHAMQEARSKAGDKALGSSSREAIESQAAQLKGVLDKMLESFPVEVRRRYGRNE